MCVEQESFALFSNLLGFFDLFCFFNFVRIRFTLLNGGEKSPGTTTR